MNLLECGHLTEEAIESYAMGRLADPEAETFEEHLLLCSDCQDRLQHMDEFVAALRVAATRMGKEEFQSPAGLPFSESLRGSLRSFWRAWTPVYALGGAVVAAALIIAVLPRTSPTRNPVVIELKAVRGTVPVVAAAQDGARLQLSLDLTGLPPAAGLKIEIAGASGQVLWTGAAARPAGDKLPVAPSIRPKPGLYWVRIYDASGDLQLLREFGLRIRD